MTDNETKLTIALYLTKGIGLQSAKKLISIFGSASAIFEARNFDILRVSKLASNILKNFPSKASIEAAETELNFIKKNNITFLRFDSTDYPYLLKQVYDCPLYIMLKGNVNLNSTRFISVVGTRNMTVYGKEFCENLIEEIAPYEPTIVSGLAYGVDITAHKMAIKYNLQNIAVVAHGLNQVYPKSHYQIASQIQNNGALLSEFDSTTIPDRENFPQRNRIIAGLSKTTIVIEAAKKGGALITAELANDYNRDVFALPGRIGDMFSEGCNNLIKNNKALLLNSPSEIIEYLGWNIKNTPIQQKCLFVETNTEEDAILLAFNSEKITLDDLALKTSLPVYKLASSLLELELKGLVRPLPGKIFQLT
ncbi:MAG: DNA-processing protein DprA [Flavobacteriales bacterium]|nr:DNA-processing protein DprA [Flavobacteriales bacterium]